MWRDAVVVIVFLAGMALQLPAAGDGAVLKQSRQCLLVITDSWNASSGMLQRFDRDKDAAWRRVGSPIPVVLGRNGLAWGRGEFKTSGLSGPRKRERDNKAPAGVFRLGTVYGYAGKPDGMNMPYLRLTKNSLAIDDPDSRYYNQMIVDVTTISKPDWNSAERPVPTDVRYKWGLVVMHNVPPIPDKGSCIFLHVWKNSSTPTSGCTAMAEQHLLTLFRWLEPNRMPLLVQLPRPIYNEVQPKWALPALR